MKKLTVLLLISLSFSASAQIVSGIYMGKLVNDSTKRVQTYELALSEYRGKISGWSYTTFVSNDTFYYSIKRIKATRTADQLIVEDDKMLINNFPEAPAKKVRQINYIQLTNEDTLRTIVGRWETTKTKVYYSLGGGMDIRRGDSSNSALVAHLRELNIIGNDNYRYTAAADVKEKDRNKDQPKNGSVASVSAKPDNKAAKTGDRTVATTSVNTPVKNTGVKETKRENSRNPDTQTSIAANNNSTGLKSAGQTGTGTKSGQAGLEQGPPKPSDNSTARQDKNTADSRSSVAAPANEMPGNEEKGSMASRTKSVSGNEHQNNADPKSPVVARAEAFVLSYDKRKMNRTNTIEVSSDSLTLAFYDNGVVDGDTISVYLNGEPVISKVRITSAATKKTIPVKQFSDIEIVLVAENLGSIPPNTGLLVIKDGEESYQLHFSADMQTNAAIVIRKKPK